MHLTDDVEFSHAGVVSVSTVSVARGYETCLFFDDRPTTPSLVVSWYPDYAAAREGHKAFTNPDVLRHIINTHFENLERLLA